MRLRSYVKNNRSISDRCMVKAKVETTSYHIGCKSHALESKRKGKKLGERAKHYMGNEIKICCLDKKLNTDAAKDQKLWIQGR